MLHALASGRTFRGPRPFINAQLINSFLIRSETAYDKRTFQVMWEMSEPDHPAAGCFMRLHQVEHFVDQDPSFYSSYDFMPGHMIINDEATSRVTVEFETLTIDTGVYLPYLLSTFWAREEGLRVHSFKPDAIVVCVGLGARTLGGVEDSNVYPDERSISYIIPRQSGDVIIGGTYGLKHASMAGRQNVSDVRSIMIESGLDYDQPVRGEFVSKLGPFSTYSDPLPSFVKFLSYNYGHGGSGYQSSWGTAEKAVELVQNLLSSLGTNYLRIFEIVEEQAGASGNAEGSASEPVPGEMEMDSHGDGFINVTELRTAVRAPPHTVLKLHLIREHRIYGIVTGLDQVQTMGTTEDGDAKIALMEWSDVVYDLVTVSIHTYERSTQVNTNTNPHFRSLLRVDPLYRCAALLLPLGGLALLPFYQTQAELDILDQEQNVTSFAKEAPYSPSFVLDLPADVDNRIKQVVDIAFLPGFNNPTLAVLYKSEFTTGGIVGRASNHWFSRVSNVANIAPPDQPNAEGFDMDNAFIEWVGTEPASSFPLGPFEPIARPERGSVCPIGERAIFIGSLDGEAALARVVRGTTEIQEEEESDDEMEDEDDLYGDTTAPTQAKSGVILQPITGLVVVDTLPAYGGINALVFALAKNGERYAPELVACTGAEYTGGFTLFQRELPTRIRRKVPAIGGARGVWSIALRKPHAQDLEMVVVSTDLAPSPGISRVAKASGNEVQILARTPGLTMVAGAFFQQTCVAQVTTNSIRLLEPDGAERQLYLDAEGNKPRPKIKVAHVADPFIVVIREDDTFGLFVGDTAKGRGTICASASFFTDHTDLFQIRKPGDVVAAHSGPGSHRRRPGESSSSKRRASRKSRGGPAASTTLENIVDAEHGTQWLVVLRKNGFFEIWTLPLIGLAFATDQLQGLPDVLVDSGQAHTVCTDGETDIEHVIIAPIGITRQNLIYRTLAIYEPVPAPPPPDSSENSAPVRDQLTVQFVKVFSRALPLDMHDTKTCGWSIPSAIQVSKPIWLFVTGDHPFWLLRTDASALRIYPHAAQYVNSFAPCSIFEKGEYLIHSDEGTTVVEWLPDVDISHEIPCRSYASDDGRVYTSVAYDVSTRHILAASALRTTFAYYDEDSNELYTPDATHPNPEIHCSALELITPDTWTTVDGYEFAQNEFVNAVESIPLETLSTERGLKDYVVVGTTISRGEDLAVKGATYVFEVVEVVPEPGSKTRQYRLRLLCREDSKGAVTALCGMNGYLVSSMGQKIFVRAFDLDEKLTGIAFMDVGVCVTSLRPLKNLLLVGDMVKSVWFVAFQEEPFKLVPLGKDRQQLSVTHADFFFGSQAQLSFAVLDDFGVLRLYDYNLIILTLIVAYD
ncbi:cleavage and polyadenylation specificity factor protein [Rhizoctonia solani]|uniref:Cleavage and polyadenylation specificity factor protein n=1 Tax=Rhizoctonia solani TaxID=456999 RepID=A0A8H8P496_9AGAM|nr:cleavage and polyadenylation specificity factor protein [Rhizoctonia solani]QRW23646.1 cleavage and polyadenylation specificity factor protein [Rhizoctonia solani]